jgi:ABC-type transport system substrate-binding protein
MLMRVTLRDVIVAIPVVDKLLANFFKWLVLGLMAVATPALSADAQKILRVAFKTAETDFDPAKRDDFYSNRIISNVFDSLLTYDYLARPAKVVPAVAEAMPDISPDGLTYTFRLKKGIYFTPDPAFRAHKRELIAADFVYSLKRILDPKIRSPRLFFLEGKLAGGDELMQAAKKSGKFDYDKPIPGLEAVDRYTLRVRLMQRDYDLLYVFADPAASAVAREVVEFYGDDIGSHPVGTGPFVLKEWLPSHRIVLEANAQYREEYFDAMPTTDPDDQEIMAALKGKRLPIVGRVEIDIIEEEQPRWLAFVNKQHDYLMDEVPFGFVAQVAPEGKLLPIYAKRGMRAYRVPDPELTYFYFNMDDPVIGGYTPEKIALRRAMSLGYNINEQVQVIYSNNVIPAQSPIGPGVAGYDPDFRTSATEYSPAKAKALLDMFGYVDRDGDGFRELPDGRPLTIEYSSPPQYPENYIDLVWLKSMREIGIRMTLNKQRWADLLKATKLGTLQMKISAWHADWPDADNFMQLLYGPNADGGQANDARFRLPEFDRLYEKAREIPDSPERDAIYREMTKLVLVYAPWRLGVHRIFTYVTHPWVVGYKKHPIVLTQFRYLDIDVEKQRKALQGGG